MNKEFKILIHTDPFGAPSGDRRSGLQMGDYTLITPVQKSFAATLEDFDYILANVLVTLSLDH